MYAYIKSTKGLLVIAIFRLLASRSNDVKWQQPQECVICCMSTTTDWCQLPPTINGSIDQTAMCQLDKYRSVISRQYLTCERCQHLLVEVTGAESYIYGGGSDCIMVFIYLIKKKYIYIFTSDRYIIHTMTRSSCHSAGQHNNNNIIYIYTLPHF